MAFPCLGVPGVVSTTLAQSKTGLRQVAVTPWKSWGERVDVIRTASEEAWGVFLREFTRWCVSDNARALLGKAPQRARVLGL